MTSSTAEGLVRVAAAVICRDGKYLVCQRPAHKRHGGLWEFPGGKLEANENLTDALRRELDEELSIEVQGLGQVLYVQQDPGSEFVIEFVETFVTGEPVALEHGGILWEVPSELAKVPLAPTDRTFVESVWKIATA